MGSTCAGSTTRATGRGPTTDPSCRTQREGRVTVTNDEDFVELADTTDHAGIIMYQQYGHTPRAFVRAVERIDRYLSSTEFRNHVEWLENWL